MGTIKKLSVFLIISTLLTSLVACNNKSQESSNSVDESWKRVNDNGKLVVGLCAAYPPFESRNENTGEIEGFDIDLATELSKDLGVDVDIKDAEWKALLGGLNKGDYDVLITCMSKRETAAENVNMSDVYYNLNDVIVVNKNNNEINSASDLKGKIVGVQLGSGSEQIVDKMESLKEVKRYEYNPEAFIDLKNNRVDAVVVGYAYAVNQIKQDNQFKVLEESLDSAEIVMVLKDGEDQLTEKLNKSLKTIKENGKYDELIDKWLKVD